MDKIPEIAKERLEELVREIKPIVRFAKVTTSRGSKMEKNDDGDLYFIKDIDPKNVAFTWKPKPTRTAKEVNPNPYKSIVTMHTYGAPTLFKPSIAEILAQIPDEDIGRCVAFETLTNYVGSTHDSSYHTTETRLYERK